MFLLLFMIVNTDSLKHSTQVKNGSKLDILAIFTLTFNPKFTIINHLDVGHISTFNYFLYFFSLLVSRRILISIFDSESLLYELIQRKQDR